MGHSDFQQCCAVGTQMIQAIGSNRISKESIDVIRIQLAHKDFSSNFRRVLSHSRFCSTASQFPSLFGVFAPFPNINCIIDRTAVVFLEGARSLMVLNPPNYAIQASSLYSRRILAIQLRMQFCKEIRLRAR